MKKELKIAVKSFLKLSNWYKFYRIHQGKLKEGPYVINLRDSTKFFIRNNFDAGALREIVIQDHYKLSQIKKDDIIVDIGAHIGIFSIMAAKRGSKVLSYEPVPDNFSLLEKNIELNHMTNIKPINKAVCSAVGKRKISLEPVNFGGHSFYSSSGSFIEIECVNLEKILTENNLEKIDLLKIDCEGAEYEILLKTKEKAMKKINKIAMEYHTIKGHNIEELVSFLGKNGFAVKKLPLSETLGQIYASR